MFSAFFIRRPKFAIVIAIVLTLAGAMSIVVLPVTEYPTISPPNIVVSGVYPGASAEVVEATVASRDPEGAALTWRWVLKEESQATEAGGDKEKVPQVIPGRLDGGAGRATLTAPDTPGAYRLFVYTEDGSGKAAHANIPFRVQ